MKLCGLTNCPIEWGFEASEDHADPFNELDLDVIVTDDGISKAAAEMIRDAGVELIIA